MAHMTYKQLIIKLENLSNAQKNMDVTVFDKMETEFFAVHNFGITEVDDILDKDHPFLIFNILD